MANSDVNYNALAANERNPFIQQASADDENPFDSDMATDTDNEDPPHHSGLMIHIVPDTSKCKWW